jgi:hypothetical protein
MWKWIYFFVDFYVTHPHDSIPEDEQDECYTLMLSVIRKIHKMARLQESDSTHLSMVGNVDGYVQAMTALWVRSVHYGETIEKQASIPLQAGINSPTACKELATSLLDLSLSDPATISAGALLVRGLEADLAFEPVGRNIVHMVATLTIWRAAFAFPSPLQDQVPDSQMIALITSALSTLLSEAKLPGSATYATGHRLFGGIEHCTQMLHNAFRAQNSISLPLQWSTTAAECKIVVLACKVAAYLHRITVAQGGNSSSQWQKLVLGTLAKITELIGYVLAGLETGCSALHRAVKKSLRSVDRYGIENFRPTVSDDTHFFWETWLVFRRSAETIIGFRDDYERLVRGLCDHLQVRLLPHQSSMNLI